MAPSRPATALALGGTVTPGMGSHPWSDAGTYIVDGTVPDPHVVLATAKPIVEGYHDIYDELLPLGSTTRVLDVGCGLGQISS